MDIPVLEAFESETGHLYVWCWHCGRWHTHGPGEGHRVAHCQDPQSPYMRTGYILRKKGPLPEKLARAIRKRLERSNYHIQQILIERRRRLKNGNALIRPDHY